MDEPVVPLALAAGLVLVGFAFLLAARSRDIPFSTLDAAGCIIVVLDGAQRVLRSTAACERVAGMPRRQIAGQEFCAVFAPGEQEARVKDALRRCQAEGKPVQLECALPGLNGERRWLLWNIVPAGRNLLSRAASIGQASDITAQKRQDRQREALALLSQHLHENGNAKDPFGLLVEQAAGLLGAQAAGLLLVNPTTGDLVLEKSAGRTASLLDGWHIPISGAVRAAFESRQPRMLAASDLEWNMLPSALGEAAGRAALIPILSQDGQAAGMLVAVGEACCEGEDLQPAVAVSLVAASILHRHNLLEANRRRLQRLTALYTINIAVSASLDIHDIFHVLVDQITSQLGVDAADIYVVDAATRDLTLTAGSGFRAGLLPKLHLWMGQGRAGQVALERKSMQLYDPTGIAPLFLPNRQLAEEDFVAYEAVPLVWKGDVRGVLETFHRAPYERDAEWTEFLESLATETIIAIANAEMMDQLQRSNRDLQTAYESTLEGWALALDLRDHDTEGHTRRVIDLTTRMAQSMGIRGDDLKYIRYGALLHDIGKIAIPDSILNKPGPLTSEEQEIMRQHPVYSRQMLASIPFLAPAMAIPCFHHERWDGSGYPDGLAGNQIPFSARVFAVVDVWDAMCSQRVYRSALPEAMVLEYIQREAGRQFDPDVVKAFISLVEWMRSHPGT